MSDAMKKLEAIRSRLTKAQQERDKLSGKAEAAMEELKKLGYKTTAEANKALIKLNKEADVVAKELDDSIKAFTKKYPELVEDD